MPDRAEFAAATAGYRRELLAYCYRFLGSIDEAEDVVQEIYLRAWRSYATFEHRSSVRTWLYRIATNACLTAFAQNARRPLPSGMAGSSSDINVPGIPDGTDIGWLQPFPTASTRPGPSDPAWVIESRGSLRLAFIAALQLLPPRQRAVLILRDVLAWRAAEVADLLGISPVAVKSILQRARPNWQGRLRTRLRSPNRRSLRLRRLLEAYVSALENADITTLVQLLRADARFEMPPFSTWFEGRDAVARFIGSRVLDRPGTLRLMPTQANGQPAVAAYRRGVDGVHRAHAIHVLTIDNTSIIRIVAFLDADLFSRFDLPREYPTAAQN
ncbi:sigma-70 family RNA polymerase sigma factor [Actinomadura madurae]|nr:sigma-70 family RNA polymerase sigma factor [Actinomadura madurae]